MRFFSGPVLGRLLGLTACFLTGASSPTIRLEDGFPAFEVPGQEAAMHSLTSLLHRHFGPQTQTTLWDAWIPRSSIWEAVGPPGEESAAAMRSYYRQSLLQRRIDDEGYVATQQHRGLAHSDGWPFPTWGQSRGAGWHFSLVHDPYATLLGVRPTTTLEGWGLTSLAAQELDATRGLSLRIEAQEAMLTTPSCSVPPDVWPFIRLEWSSQGVPLQAHAFLEWTTEDQPTFHIDRRVELPWPGDSPRFVDVPLYRHAPGRATLTRLRLRFEGATGAKIGLVSLITAIDTRHPINNAIYLTACCDYFNITTDLEFLRANIGRMRKAVQFALDEFQVRTQHMVVVPWVGHDGRSGLSRRLDGTSIVHHGRGVGNNYWDLLPFGGRDFQATLYLYHALRQFAALERQISLHQDRWQIPDTSNLIPAQQLEELANALQRQGGTRFWNAETGRFVGWIDTDGQARDFGFTTLNTEAIAYGFATAEQARSILDWLGGRRVVAGDTSTGRDIYHWRFAPRATTLRNTSVYCWVWSGPETIPWGGQVQDGGAVLGFSYFDLMARLATTGPDDAWSRLREIVAWFDEVEAEGGYRAYYARPGRGTLQGGGPPGGLGLDAEFLESVLVPQVMLEGFLGFQPEPGGFAISPRLPSDWPSLTITRIALQDVVLDLEATPTTITIHTRRAPEGGSSLSVRVDGAAAGTQVRCLPGGRIRLERQR